MNKHGMLPVLNQESVALVLGSFPGVESLKKQQYYAHSRNQFWPLMESILGIDSAASYEEKLRLLGAQRVGLWDVVRGCARRGSLDQDIRIGTVTPNNFIQLFHDFPNIQFVFFNGKCAQALFEKLVLGRIEPKCALSYATLPSTSPAHAAMSFKEKLGKWRVLKQADTTLRSMG